MYAFDECIFSPHENVKFVELSFLSRGQLLALSDLVLNVFTVNEGTASITRGTDKVSHHDVHVVFYVQTIEFSQRLPTKTPL